MYLLWFHAVNFCRSSMICQQTVILDCLCWSWFVSYNYQEKFWCSWSDAERFTILQYSGIHCKTATKERHDYVQVNFLPHEPYQYFQSRLWLRKPITWKHVIGLHVWGFKQVRTKVVTLTHQPNYTMVHFTAKDRLSGEVLDQLFVIKGVFTFIWDRTDLISKLCGLIIAVVTTNIMAASLCIMDCSSAALKCSLAKSRRSND